MPADPDIKRAVSFIDGQNLYRHAKDAFGHYHPNYDPSKLADAVCADYGWVNSGVRFYTSVPSAHRAPMWHGYWTRRLTAMRRAGIAVTSRPLRYRVETVRLPDRSVHELPVEREKGVDLRLGLDVVRMARNAELDVAILFSQDQDLAEVAQEVRDISRGADRWLKVVARFRMGRTPRRRGASTGPTGSGWIVSSTMPASMRGTIGRVGDADGVGNGRGLSRGGVSSFIGQGNEMVERLTNPISIFARRELDFSQNRAEHDDILGDAYEYLMRHFATESGKSKGQFYTPAEVSRIIAQVIGISPRNTNASTTAYDPTCGSGSLLLKAVRTVSMLMNIRAGRDGNGRNPIAA